MTTQAMDVDSQSSKDTPKDSAKSSHEASDEPAADADAKKEVGAAPSPDAGVELGGNAPAGENEGGTTSKKVRFNASDL